MSIQETLTPTPPPVRLDADGVLRVGRSRLTLDLVVRAYTEGASAEEIALRFAPIALADVYDVIAYYLRHRGVLDEYLRESDRLAGALDADCQTASARALIRERLLARRDASRLAG